VVKSKFRVALIVMAVGVLALGVVLKARGAFNGSVTNWIDNWSEDGTNVTVAIASFPEMTAAEADAATGDIRDVTYALVDMLYDEWESKAAADRPAYMTIGRTTSVTPGGGSMVYSYTFKFTVALTPGEIEDES